MRYNFEGKIININDKELETLEKNHKDLTREECIYLWLEDNEIVDNEEIDEMTEKGKKNVKIYNKSTKERKKSTLAISNNVSGALALPQIVIKII